MFLLFLLRIAFHDFSELKVKNNLKVIEIKKFLSIYFQKIQENQLPKTFFKSSRVFLLMPNFANNLTKAPEVLMKIEENSIIPSISPFTQSTAPMNSPKKSNFLQSQKALSSRFCRRFIETWSVAFVNMENFTYAFPQW